MDPYARVRRLRWVNHLARMNDDEPVRKGILEQDGEEDPTYAEVMALTLRASKRQTRRFYLAYEFFG